MTAHSSLIGDGIMRTGAHRWQPDHASGYDCIKAINARMKELHTQCKPKVWKHSHTGVASSPASSGSNGSRGKKMNIP